MKEIFKSKKRWIAFFLALLLIVTTCINSSDVFLWATGEGETATSEQSENEPAEEVVEIEVEDKEEADPKDETNPEGTTEVAEGSVTDEVTDGEEQQAPAEDAGQENDENTAQAPVDGEVPEEEITEENPEIPVETITYGYAVYYYYDGVEDEGVRVEGKGALGDAISVSAENEVVHNEKNYVLDHVENKDGKIGEDAGQNVAKVYYVLKPVEKPAQTLTAVAEDGAKVTVSAPEGSLPEGAGVKVSVVYTKSIESAVEDAMNEEGKTLVNFKAYDITIYDKDGKEIQPDEKVTVNIQNTGVEGDEASVYHVDGKAADKITDIVDGNKASFSAEHFSIYVVAGGTTQAPEQLKVEIRLKYENGTTVPGYPYIMLLEKTDDGYEVDHEVVLPGYSFAIEGDSADIKIDENGKITGKYAADSSTEETKVIQIKCTAKNASYTVKYLYEDENGRYQEDAGLQKSLSGKTGELTKAEVLSEENLPDTFKGLVPQPIEQKVIAYDNSTIVEIKYDRATYTLIYNPEGGSYVPSVTGKGGTRITLAAGPTRQGYKFVGWNDEEGKRVQSPYTLVGDVILHAQWEATETTYKVVYMTENADDDGYSYAGTVELKGKTGDTVTADGTTPKPAGFDTKNFYFDGEASTASVKADGSTVVLAFYHRNIYTITFPVQDNSGKLICGKEEHTHTYTNRRKEDSFLGWGGYWTYRGGCYGNTYTRSPQCGKTEHTHSDSCYAKGKLTITAKYEANIKDQWLALIEKDYPNYVWYVTDSKWTKLQTKMPEGGMVLKKGEPREEGYGTTKRTLIYYVEDKTGTVTYNDIKFREYAKYTLYTKNGSGWFSSGEYPTYDEEFMEIDGYDRFASNVEPWTDGKKHNSDSGTWAKGDNCFYYTLSKYDLVLKNGDQEEKHENISYTSDITQYLKAPSYNPLGDGIFEGWYTDPEFKEPCNLKTMPKDNLIVYAKWTPVTYKVSFVDDQKHPVHEETVNRGAVVGYYHPDEKEGYTFQGWFTDEEYTQSFDFGTPIESDTTLYGKWQEKAFTTYTVRYESEDGKELAKPEVFERMASGTTVLVNAKDIAGYETATPTLSKTLVADPTQNVITFVYKEVKGLRYVVRYTCDGKDIVDPIEESTDAAKLKVYAKNIPTGYKLADGESASKDLKLERGKTGTVEFKCVKAEYKITYKNVTGATWLPGNPSTYKFGDPDIKLNAPAKDGWNFIGWDFTTLNGEATVEAHNPAQTVIKKGSYGDLEFTARWAKLEADGWDDVYDGAFHAVSASVVADDGTDVTGYTISYSLNGQDWSTTVPSIKNVNDGPKTVYVKAEKEGYITLETEAELNVKPFEILVKPDDNEKNYGEDDPKPLTEVKVISKMTDKDGNAIPKPEDSYIIKYSDLEREAGEDVKDYKITVKAEKVQNNGNYIVETEDGTFTIKEVKRPTEPTIEPTGDLNDGAANGYHGTYDNNSHGIKVSNLQPGDEVEYSDDGGKTWVKGTTTTDGQGAITSEFGEYVHVGNNNIQVKITNKNYPNDVDLTGTVVIEPFKIVVKANDEEKDYGKEDPIFTGTWAPDYPENSGMKKPDDNVEITYKKVLVDGKETLERELGEDVKADGYKIYITGAEIQGNIDPITKRGDYTVKFEEGTLTIKPIERPDSDKPDIEPTGDKNDGSTKGYVGVYDAKKHGIEVIGIEKNKDTVEYRVQNADGTWPDEWSATNPLYKDVFGNEEARTIQVKVTNPNYTWTEDDILTGTVRILRRPVTVTADPANKIAGDKDPEFTATVSDADFLKADEATLTYVVTRPGAGTDEAIGVYEKAIVPKGELVQENYSITYVPATFTINAADRQKTPEFDIYRGVYDAQSHGISYIDGLVNGDTIRYSYRKQTEEGTWTEWSEWTNETDAANWSKTNPQFTDVTTAEVKVEVKNPIYEDFTVIKTVTIMPKTVTVRAEDKTKEYGAVDPELTVELTDKDTIEGLLGDDTIEYSLSRAEGEDAGQYTITVSGEEIQGNYKVICENGTLTITPLDITNSSFITLRGKNVYQTYNGDPLAAGEATVTAQNGITTGLKIEYSKDGINWYEDRNQVSETNYTSRPVQVQVRVTGSGNYTGTKQTTETIRIDKATLWLTSQTLTKPYDKKPLTNGENKLFVESGWVKDEGASYNFTESQTLVGFTTNDFEVIPNAGTDLSNYRMVKVAGFLIVTDIDVEPEAVVTKTHQEGEYNEGNEVTFEISVTNMYEGFLPKVITLREIPGVELEKDRFVLKAGETATTKATYTITEEDIKNGSFVNTVSAKYPHLLGREYTATDTVETKEISRAYEISKELVNAKQQGEVYNVGEKLQYKITITSKANVTLSNIVVSDQLNEATGSVEFTQYPAESLDADSNTVTISNLAPRAIVELLCEYEIVKDDAGKQITNIAVAQLGNDPEKETDPTDPAEVEEAYTLIIHYVYATGGTVEPDFRGKYVKGESYEVTSPVIEGYSNNRGIVKGEMPANDMEITVIYSMPTSPTTPGGGGGGTTPTPPTPPTPDGPNPIIVPDIPVPAGAIEVVIPAELVPLGDEEVPLQGAQIDVDEDGNVTVTPISEEEIPLAGGENDDHLCCILHFLLMLAALIIYTCYTSSMKKHQKKLAELKDQLAEETLKKQLGITDGRQAKM